MKTSEMIGRRHELKLEWVEPLSTLGPEGEEVPTGNLVLSATVHDCVNHTRWVHAQIVGDHAKETDEELLMDFMAVHWAQPVKEARKE